MYNVGFMSSFGCINFVLRSVVLSLHMVVWFPKRDGSKIRDLLIKRDGTIHLLQCQ